MTNLSSFVLACAIALSSVSCVAYAADAPEVVPEKVLPMGPVGALEMKLELCRISVASRNPKAPEQAVLWMKNNGWSDVDIGDTLRLCAAFEQGVSFARRL